MPEPTYSNVDNNLVKEETLTHSETLTLEYIKASLADAQKNLATLDADYKTNRALYVEDVDKWQALLDKATELGIKEPEAVVIND